MFTEAPPNNTQKDPSVLAVDNTDDVNAECLLQTCPTFSHSVIVSVAVSKLDRVYQTEIHDVDELKQRLIAVWADMKHSVINKAIDEWRSRLAACVRAKG